MATDKNGRVIDVGDTVLVQATVTQTFPPDIPANQIEVSLPNKPDGTPNDPIRVFGSVVKKGVL